MMLAVVALFLPLFPLSVAQNLILARLRAPLRAALLLLWPQFGVTVLQLSQPAMRGFVVTWAILSAAFYAVRLLTVRDLGLWAVTFTSSALALTWGLIAYGADETALRLFILWFSLPPALLVLLTVPLSRRFGAAYAGLVEGLAQAQPRLTAVLTAVILATIATPPFPGFFALLGLLRGLSSAAVLGVLAVWLLWGWAATRMLQGLLTGSSRESSTSDLEPTGLLTYTAVLVVFTAVGLQVMRGGL